MKTNNEYPMMVSEDGNLTAYLVGNGDIFVKNGRGDKIRISLANDIVGGIIVTASGQNMTPWMKNGLPAIHVIRK